MHRLAALLLLSFAVFASAAQPPAAETAKIEYLIREVQSLQGAQFFRNGVAYSAAAAGEHMRLKWRMAGTRVASAEDFIRYCASVSSVSGLPYTIRFADGRVVTAAQFLTKKLSEYPRVGPPGV
jgi:Family of unknown function (DUF5329)